MKARHRFSPIGDCAIRIRRCNVLKNKEGPVVPKRVKECYTSIKIGSHAGGTTDFEVDRSELYRPDTLNPRTGYRCFWRSGARLQHQDSAQPNRPYGRSCFHRKFSCYRAGYTCQMVSSESHRGACSVRLAASTGKTEYREMNAQG